MRGDVTVSFGPGDTALLKRAAERLRASEESGSKDPKQGALLNECNVTLTKALVSEHTLRHSDHWVGNGVWMLSKKRLAETSFLTCGCCLERLNKGQRQMMETPAGGAERLIRSAKKLFEYKVTTSVEIVDGEDYIVCLRADDPDRYFLLSRCVIEGFELDKIYAASDKGPAFDAPEKDDITLIIEVLGEGEVE